MSLVAMYFSDPEPEGAPFNKHGGTCRRGYLQLATQIVELGGKCCFVRGKDTFLGGGSLKK